MLSPRTAAGALEFAVMAARLHRRISPSRSRSPEAVSSGLRGGGRGRGAGKRGGQPVAVDASFTLVVGRELGEE